MESLGCCFPGPADVTEIETIFESKLATQWHACLIGRLSERVITNAWLGKEVTNGCGPELASLTFGAYGSRRKPQ